MVRTSGSFPSGSDTAKVGGSNPPRPILKWQNELCDTAAAKSFSTALDAACWFQVSKLVVVILLGFLSTSQVLAASPGSGAGLSGTFVGLDTSRSEDGITQVGTGNFAGLGNFSFVSVGRFEPATVSGCLDHATFLRVFSGSHDEKLYLTVDGNTCPTTTGSALFNGTYIILGGTQEFEGATGSGKVLNNIDTSTGSFRGNLSGTLNLISPLTEKMMQNLPSLADNVTALRLRATTLQGQVQILTAVLYATLGLAALTFIVSMVYRKRP